MSVPESPYPLDAEGFEHPHWCDQSICTAPSSLRIRGQEESSVPFSLLGAHLGTAKVVEGDRTVETRFTLQPWRMVDQPVTNVVEGVDLRVETKDERLKAIVMTTVEQLGPLARAFAEVRDIALTGKPRTAVDRAIRALAEFGVLDAGVAARMVPMFREHLTRAEVETVVGWFVDSNDEFLRGEL